MAQTFKPNPAQNNVQPPRRYLSDALSLKQPSKVFSGDSAGPGVVTTSTGDGVGDGVATTSTGAGVVTTSTGDGVPLGSDPPLLYTDAALLPPQISPAFPAQSMLHSVDAPCLS